MDEEMMFEMSAGSLEGLPSVGEMFDLTGKVAVVSGTIGLALSVIYRLASCGAKVVFGARREVIGQMAEERLREMGLDVRFHKLDDSSVESCREIVAFAEQTYGTVDIVVPVAAAFFARAFVDIKESEYDRIVDVDQKGQYFLVQAAARSMIRGKKGGKVVIRVTVDASGKVTGAAFEPKGSTESDAALVAAAVAAARKARFTESRAAVQGGTITYIFRME